MQSLRKIFYPPTIGLFLYVLFILTLLVLLPLLLIGATKLVFANLGFSFTDALLIIVLSLLGSTVNIPLFKIKTREPVLKIDYYTFFWCHLPDTNGDQRSSRNARCDQRGGCAHSCDTFALSVVSLLRVHATHRVSGVVSKRDRKQACKTG